MITVDDNDFSLQLQGIQIPLYRCCCNSLTCFEEQEEEQSLLNSILLSQWEDRMWKGLFRYDVTTSEIKVVGGRRKFIAQFNQGWSRECLPKLGESKMCCGDVF